MSDATKVVAHLNDGRILQGTTQDFFPNRDQFHLILVGSGQAIELKTRDLKGLFFVKDFGGDPLRKDVPGFLAGPQETGQGRKVAVVFRDDELLCGYTLSFMPDRKGFFLFPSDRDGNNLRVYVVMSSTREVAAGPAAEALARRASARETG